MYVSTQPRVALGAYRPIVIPRRRVALRRRPQTLGASAAGGIATNIGVKAATAAVTFIPVVGPFLAPLVGTIAGLFGAKHSQAMATEAQGMNAAVPAYYAQLQAIVDATNQGQVPASQASSMVDQAVADYYATVKPIMKKSGACPGGGRLPGDPCNAACNVGCAHVELDATATKKALASGGGTVQISGFQSNGQIAGWAPMTLSVSPSSSGVAGVLGGSAAGIPMWVWIAGGGAALLLVVMSMRK